MVQDATSTKMKSSNYDFSRFKIKKYNATTKIESKTIRRQFKDQK